MKKKATCHIRNWSESNASLKHRGSLSARSSPEAVENWTTDELTGDPCASPICTDRVVDTIAMV